jgi:Spy/CpxP family protein refolding chaperone
MNLRRTVSIVMAMMLSLSAANAFAQGPWRGGMGRDGFDTLPLLIHSAGLNENQQAQVRQIIGNHRTQLRALREQLRTAETQLGDKLVATTPVTGADLAPLTQQVNQARSNLAHEWMQVVMEIRGILKPEQLAKAAQNRQKLNQLREEMRTVLGGSDTP